MPRLSPADLGREFSHTDTLCEVVAECLRSHNVGCEIVRLVDYNIKPGIKLKMGKGDEWPGILKKVLDADIIVFATPVWWGLQSSLMQRAIERMDELHSELLETGKSRLANKVGGIVITARADARTATTTLVVFLATRSALPVKSSITSSSRGTPKSFPRLNMFPQSVRRLQCEKCSMVC